MSISKERVSIFCNNAGINHTAGWRKCLDVNLVSEIKKQKTDNNNNRKPKKKLWEKPSQNKINHTAGWWKCLDVNIVIIRRKTDKKKKKQQNKHGDKPVKIGQSAPQDGGNGSIKRRKD